jgi:hypothetical protein
MANDTRFFPTSGSYIAVPGTIYAQYLGVCPNPCRKYHVSSAIESAEAVANITLPFLASHRIFHKIVQSRSMLVKQTYKDKETFGDQAGKFITIYMDPNVEQRNSVIRGLADLLSALAKEQSVEPCPRIPRSRSYSHVFAEQPLDENFFIYGGFHCDPTE